MRNITLIAALCVCVWLAAADDTEYFLVTDLFRNYDKRLRPSTNYTEVLNVTFGMALNSIMEVDERNQVLVTNSWLNLGWVDVRLRWNPAVQRGIEEIRLPISNIWTPDIILYNNADPMSAVSTVSTNAIIRYDGNVTWLSTAILKSSCQITVRDFPFDIQECSLQFASWTFGGRQIDLTQVSEQGDISVYKQNTEWQLVSFTSKRNLNNFSCCPEPWPDITYYIRIDRRPLFYVFNLILPCIMITIVAMFSFLVPCDSGEKITTTITTLLSMTVFLLLVTEQLPPSAIALPLIGVYYGLTMAIVSAATIATVVTLNLYYKNDVQTEVPACVKALCFRVLAPIFCINVKAELLNSCKSDGARARNGKTEETTFYAAGEPLNAHCGSPHCPCTVQTHNGTCGMQLSPQQAPFTTQPLLCCPHEYRPCGARVSFCANSNSISPQNTVRYDSAPSCFKDAPSLHRFQSLVRPAAFGVNSSPSTSDGNEQEPPTAIGSISTDLRDMVTQKYYSNNRHFQKTPFPEGRDSAEKSDALARNSRPELVDILDRFCRCMERQEQVTIDKERRHRLQREWRLLAIVVDRCFFWLFIITASVITITLFSQARCTMH